ncbi:MAG TPA: Do family serine endopeptidase [Methylomirabilota bacterium]|nr:Do family serine endopeptidase [Methylomirabilota bacterium]
MTPQAARAILLAGVLFALAGTGFGLYGWLTLARRSAPVVSSPVATADALQAAFVAVAEQVRPAVVNIGTVQVARSRRAPAVPGPGTDDPFFKDFFDQFFGRGGPGRREEFRQPGLGSGVIIDKRGYVLTNFHVIRGADSVTVKLPSKQEFQGRIVGTDAKTDLAVVRFQPEGDVRVAALGDSDTLRVGEWAIAIGNPFGLDQTVTVGVISATGRAEVGIATYENFIQTDASINPGNSGGPLVNLKGEVIGINTAIVATGQGIGFAIPANMVKRVTAQLIDRGKVTRGWIGVSLQPLTAELAQSLGLDGTRGAIVARVHPGSPADVAGVQPNDVIVKFGPTAIDDYHHLQRLSSEAEPGTTVALEIVRKKGRRSLELKITESPDTTPATAPTPSAPPRPR